MAGSVNALTIQGALWAPADTSAQGPGIFPTSSSIASFTVDAINFDSRRGTLSYDSFLSGANGPSNPNNLQWLSWDASSLYDKDSFYTAGGLGSFFQFTGTAYFAANMKITHDDGFYLTLDGTVYDHSTPTSPLDTYLGNSAGTYDFTLNYGAWNGFPEVLIAPMSAPVPEPSTIFLLAGGLLGLGCYGRKRKKS